MLHKVKKAVRIKGTYKINIEFDKGENRIFDFTDYIGGKSFIFGPLKNSKTFDLFEVKDGTIIWETGADFCPNVLYSKSDKINNNNNK